MTKDSKDLPKPHGSFIRSPDMGLPCTGRPNCHSFPEPSSQSLAKDDGTRAAYEASFDADLDQACRGYKVVGNKRM